MFTFGFGRSSRTTPTANTGGVGTSIEAMPNGLWEDVPTGNTNTFVTMEGGGRPGEGIAQNLGGGGGLSTTLSSTCCLWSNQWRRRHLWQRTSRVMRWERQCLHAMESGGTMEMQKHHQWRDTHTHVSKLCIIYKVRKNFHDGS